MLEQMLEEKLKELNEEALRLINEGRMLNSEKLFELDREISRLQAGIRSSVQDSEASK